MIQKKTGSVFSRLTNDSRLKRIRWDILKLFDAADEPFLTSSEIADELPVSRQAVNYRLKQMLEKNLVGKKKTALDP